MQWCIWISLFFNSHLISVLHIKRYRYISIPYSHLSTHHYSLFLNTELVCISHLQKNKIKWRAVLVVHYFYIWGVPAMMNSKLRHIKLYVNLHCSGPLTRVLLLTFTTYWTSNVNITFYANATSSARIIINLMYKQNCCKMSAEFSNIVNRQCQHAYIN